MFGLQKSLLIIFTAPILLSHEGKPSVCGAVLQQSRLSYHGQFSVPKISVQPSCLSGDSFGSL